MIRPKPSLFAVCFILILSSTSARADQRSNEVSRLFAKWDSKDTPGMNVSVARDGKEIYSRSFGMASLENAIPNAPEIVYPIGSISKQFTGFCIQLLATEGKLSTADNIRRYLPEIHDFGKPITIGMLLTHTSGLRDNVGLLMIKGRRVDDVVSENESFDVITHQTGMNFRPGSRYLYSNANYVLLAKIVERVSGVSFADFLQKRVLSPLGLSHTSVVTDPLRVTRRRATGYSGDRDYLPQTAADSTFGNTGILSTVHDLATWSALFYEPGSWDSEVIAQMERPGRLDDGLPITYGSGLHIESFHGLPYVEHTGAVPGFHSDVLVFPKQRLSIILLANTDACDSAALSFATAAVFLRDEFLPKPPKPNAVPSPPPEVLKHYAGFYEIVSGTSQIAPGRLIKLTPDPDGLHYGDEKVPLLASSDHDFFSQVSDLRISFVAMRDEPGHWMLVLHDPSGTDFAGREKEVAASPTHEAPMWKGEDYEGHFYCPELDTTYSVIGNRGALRLRTPRGEIDLAVQGPDRFEAKGRMNEGTIAGTLVFTRTDHAIDGFNLSVGNRVADVRFVKMALATATRGGK